jgi:hypothetical protein
MQFVWAADKSDLAERGRATKTKGDHHGSKRKSTVASSPSPKLTGTRQVRH